MLLWLLFVRMRPHAEELEGAAVRHKPNQQATSITHHPHPPVWPRRMLKCCNETSQPNLSLPFPKEMTTSINKRLCSVSCFNTMLFQQKWSNDEKKLLGLHYKIMMCYNFTWFKFRFISKIIWNSHHFCGHQL